MYHLNKIGISVRLWLCLSMNKIIVIVQKDISVLNECLNLHDGIKAYVIKDIETKIKSFVENKVHRIG